MGAVGMDHLVIQWVTDIAAFEPNSSPIAQTTIDCVRRVMASAATRHIGVWLGLASNDRWDNGAPFTDGEVTLSIQVLQELYGLLGEYRTSISGFYIPFEIDNLRFQTPDLVDQICNQFSRITEEAHNYNKPVMVAPFYNQNLEGGQQPVEYAGLWQTILSATKIDVLALQDGMGPRDPDPHASLDRLPEWFCAFRTMINGMATRTELWSDVETYYQSGKDSISAPVSRVIDQLTTEDEFVDRFTSFSFNHFDSPGLSRENQDKYIEYSQWVNAGLRPI